MIRLRIEGMSCGHCVKAVTQAVLALDAGAEVQIDLAERLARISSKADAGAIIAAINDAGYDAAPAD